MYLLQLIKYLLSKACQLQKNKYCLNLFFEVKTCLKDCVFLNTENKYSLKLEIENKKYNCKKQLVKGCANILISNIV